MPHFLVFLLKNVARTEKNESDGSVPVLSKQFIHGAPLRKNAHNISAFST